MDNTNIFAYATRTKLRFSSPKGSLDAEMLWDVPLRDNNGFNLGAIAKSCNNALKEATEENFVAATRTAEHVRLEMSLDIVKHVIAVKLAEEEAAKKRAANKAEKQELVAILAEKQKGKLNKLSETAIKERIAALDA